MSENGFSLEEIYKMSDLEKKKNRCSIEFGEDDVGNSIATWCQVKDGILIISQANVDMERKHFTNYVGMTSTVRIQDVGIITDLYSH